METYNLWLIVAGALSAIASLVHLFCVWGGAPWYRFFGAGERLTRQVENGAIAPAIVTLLIAGMLALWSIYAFSGAGVIPLLSTALTLITAIYLARAFAFPLLVRMMPDRSRRFLVTSSAIVFAVGLLHAIGLYQGLRIGSAQLQRAKGCCQHQQSESMM